MIIRAPVRYSNINDISLHPASSQYFSASPSDVWVVTTFCSWMSYRHSPGLLEGVFRNWPCVQTGAPLPLSAPCFISLLQPWDWAQEASDFSCKGEGKILLALGASTRGEVSPWLLAVRYLSLEERSTQRTLKGQQGIRAAQLSWWSTLFFCGKTNPASVRLMQSFKQTLICYLATHNLAFIREIVQTCPTCSYCIAEK